jgi:2,4-dienoyl-CoA reductase-like NADH-dependent reductase (Old Yellow Enzyme family)/thioredoxin reductase
MLAHLLEVRAVDTYDALLQPLILKGLTIPNRIMSTSHAPAYGEDGKPKERYQLYHEEKARGGIGLTMFGGSASVAVDSPASPWKQLDLADDAILPWLEEFAERIHRHGTALMCQITHMGRRTRWDVGSWVVPISSSPVREPSHRSMPRAMDLADMRRVRRSYSEAALRCRRGGLDGCEVLFASHLIAQFLSPRVNQRRDAYGGSLANRLRFGLEVLECVREAVGDDYPVGMRMTADEMATGGLSSDECLEVFQRVAASGFVDFLNVIGGEVFRHDEMPDYMPNMAYPEAPYLHLASAVKKATELPVFHATRVLSLEEAARALEGGHVDMVGMTRAHIADPHIVRKLREGRAREIRPCVGANYCIDRIYLGKDSLCLHNAATGREARIPHRIPRAEHQTRVVIVGAGPGGLEAARVCAERGHAVVVFEREAHTGGQLRLAARAPWREPLLGITDWLEAEVRRLGVDLRLGALAGAETVRAEEPDSVVVATGGRPHDASTTHGDGVVSTWAVLGEEVAPRGDVLVFDDHGDHQAVSCAEFLAARGARVEIVTPDRTVAEELGSTNFAIHLRHLYRDGVSLTPDHRLVGVRREHGRLRARLRNEYSGLEQTREVDLVVVEHGTLPVDELFHALEPFSRNLGQIDWTRLREDRIAAIDANPEGDFTLFRVGDAVAGRNVHAAIYDAMRVCKDL